MQTKSKKAFTLIEVVVALGILAMVFAGTVTLVVNVVKLAISARERTEAIVFAQQGLARGIQETFKNPSGYTGGTDSLGGITLVITKDTTNFNLNDGLDKNNFYHITSKVTWPKNPAGYTLEQYVWTDVR